MCKKRSPHSLPAVAPVVLCALASIVPLGMTGGVARAEERLWVGQGTLWENNASWFIAKTPTADDTAVFSYDGSLGVLLGKALPASGMLFTSSGREYTISLSGTASPDAGLTLGAGGIINNSPAGTTQTIAVPLTLTSSMSFTTATVGATTSVSENIALGNIFWGINGAGNTLLSSTVTALSGTSPLFQKSGTGTLTMTGGSVATPSRIGQASISRGTMVLEGGHLALESSFSNPVGRGLVVVEGALIVREAGVASTQSAQIASFGATETGATVTIDGVGSRLSVANNLTIGNYGNGVLTVQNGGHVEVGTLTLEESREDFDGVNASVTVDGSGSNLSVAGGITLSGSGNGVLGGPGNLNIRNGATLNAGSLAIAFPLNASNGAYLNVTSGITGTAGTITLEDGTNDIAALTINQSQNTVFSGTITGTGSFVKAGTGTLQLTQSLQNTGTITLSGGSLLLPGASVYTNRFVAKNGTTFLLPTASTFHLPVGGAITAEVGSTVAYNGAVVNGGRISGDGTHRVDAGGVTFNGTRMGVGTNLSLVAGSATLNGLDSSTNITVGSGRILTLNDATNTAAGRINVRGGGSLLANGFLQNGILNLSGTLTNVADTALIFGGGSRTTVNVNGTLDTGGRSLDLNGALLVHNGNLTGGGAVNVNFGSRLQGEGNFGMSTINVGLGGVYSPGNSPGQVSAAGMTWGAGGSMLWEIADANGAAGSAYDSTNLSGVLDIAAGTTTNSRFTLSLASLLPDFTPGALAGFDPSASYNWVLVTAAGGVTGFEPARFFLDTAGFAATNPGTSGGRFSLSQSGNSLRLNYVGMVVVVPEPNAVLLLLLGIPPVVFFRHRNY